MILNIANHDFSIIWKGVYYKTLSNYPNISKWEMKNIIDFIEYEKEHNRTVTFDIEDKKLHDTISSNLQNKNSFLNITRPNKITECTACKQGGCMTDYLCHVAPVENSINIFKTGKLLSARNARKESIDDLVKEDRNAAKDPTDFFDYIMFSWGNCQAGDRLVMERKYNRPPTEDDLSINFTPGIRFYFKYDDLINHSRVKFDGYHALKIRDELEIKSYLEAIIIPEKYFDIFKNLISDSIFDKVHYLKNDCKDIWDWSEKVYDYISRGYFQNNKVSSDY